VIEEVISNLFEGIDKILYDIMIKLAEEAGLL